MSDEHRPDAPGPAPVHADAGADAGADAWEPYASPRADAADAVVGDLRVRRGVHSPRLGNERDVLVWLPPGYAEQTDRRYPALYMHDGQNLFDPATSFAGEWHVDGVMQQLAGEGVEAIVVGIPNAGPERFDEYSPFRDPKHGGGRADAYLAFLVETVKPLVDAAFRTDPRRECTGLAGSSLGGLVSLYGFFARSETFGFAAAMSPALWVVDAAIFDVVERAPFAPGRLYLDVGTREGVPTVRNVRRMRDLLRRKGYDELLCVAERGAGHDEDAWGRRVGGALRFLLGNGSDA